MGPRAQLEQALRASFAREDLAVYADLLLAEGDPRGELIALDLDPQPTPAWHARRREVIEAWLGASVAAVALHRLHRGFISELDDSAAALAVLASPAGAFVRAFGTRGETRTVRTALAKLAAAPRPWLTRLSIERLSTDLDPCVGRALVDELIAHAPALAELDIAGRMVMHGFPHPDLTALRVSGFDALAAWSPMPAVARLDLASTPSGPGARPDATTLALDATMLPALTHLDVSREEPWPDRPERIWDALRTWPIRTQITHLVLPSFDEEDVPQLARTLDAMPALADVRVARMYGDHGAELRARTPPVAVPPVSPWPRPRLIHGRDAFAIRIPEHPVAEYVDVHGIVAYLERSYFAMPRDAQRAWTQFWEFTDALGWENERGEDLVEPFPFAVLDLALAACGDDLEDRSGRWAELRLQLRVARDRVDADAPVQIRRYWGW